MTVMGRREMRAIFWLENLQENDYLEDLGVDDRITLKWILGKYSLRVWIGFIWFMIGRVSGLFQAW